ncbi:pirin family protein [Ottowia sp.]|uniref:pirin family protein n=1 Tax=Ottowia sp. TaxID=1898956 RepID=UPI003A8C0903
MEKKVIGTSRAPALQPVGDAYQEHVFFDYRGLGRQANPAIRASYAPAQTVVPTDSVRTTGAQAQRGFECVTILLQGQLQARDSARHTHALAAGDVLWGGAGRGVLREQQHGPDLTRNGGTLELLTLWINLPAQYKLTDPHCQHLPAADIPEVALPGGAGTVRVMAGEYGGQTGPAETVTPLQLWDLHLQAGHTVKLPLPLRWYGVLLLIQGQVQPIYWQQTVRAPELVFVDAGGEEITLDVEQDSRAILLCSQPVEESVAGIDALVMNTDAELVQAQQDLQNGAFGALD